MTVPTDKLYSVKEMVAFNILEAKNEITKLKSFSLLLESKKGSVTSAQEAHLLKVQIRHNAAAIQANLSDIARYEAILTEIKDDGSPIKPVVAEEVEGVKKETKKSKKTTQA